MAYHLPCSAVPYFFAGGSLRQALSRQRNAGLFARFAATAFPEHARRSAMVSDSSPLFIKLMSIPRQTEDRLRHNFAKQGAWSGTFVSSRMACAAYALFRRPVPIDQRQKTEPPASSCQDSAGIRHTLRLKSKVMRCVLLKAAYSSSTSSTDTCREIFPSSDRMS